MATRTSSEDGLGLQAAENPTHAISNVRPHFAKAVVILLFYPTCQKLPRK